MTDREAIALKPCPFCGSSNVKQGGDDKVVGVWCENCQASGPNGYLTINGDFDWNTRSLTQGAGWRTDMESAPNRTDVLLYQDGWAINPVIVGRRHDDVWLSDCFEIDEPDQRPTHWKALDAPTDHPTPSVETAARVKEALDKAANEAIQGHVERTDRFAEGFRCGLFRMKAAALRSLSGEK